MFRSIILSIAIIFITFNGIKCTEECKASAKTCSSFHDLEKDTSAFTKWGHKQCPDNTTVLKKEVVDEYKGCIKKHLEPCLKDSPTLKTLFSSMFDKFDLCHICQDKVQEEINKEIMNIIETKEKELMDEGDKKCSEIREAISKIKACAKIPD